MALSCGGQSSHRADDDEGPDGANAEGCTVEGVRHEAGEQFTTADGCWQCTCTNSGGHVCVESVCTGNCLADGRVYQNGESFTFDDNGCGTCTCNDGEVACVTMPCPGGRCAVLPSLYQTHERY